MIDMGDNREIADVCAIHADGLSLNFNSNTRLRRIGRESTRMDANQDKKAFLLMTLIGLISTEKDQECYLVCSLALRKSDEKSCLVTRGSLVCDFVRSADAAFT